MPRRSVQLVVILALVLALVCPGAHAYKKVKVFMPQAPELQLAGVKQIAVLDLKPASGTSKDAGKYLADKLIEYLLTEDRGIRNIQGGLLASGTKGMTLINGVSTKIYSIVERSRLESVLNEQSLSTDGLVDDAQAIELGKILGVDVLVYGDIAVGMQDNSSVETRVSFSGNTKQEYYVDCLLRDVSVSASVRIVSTQTGEILGTRRSSYSSSSKFCDGDKEPIADVGTLAARCADNLAWEFAGLISPWYAPGEFELEKIKAKEFKNEAETAAEAAEQLEIDRAYAIYKKLYDSDSYNPQFLFNMGVLYEVTGDFAKAREMYEGAASLKAESAYKDAVERMEKRARLVQFCEGAGLTIEPFDFEAAAADASLLAKKVTVKGGSDDRVDVYAEPNEGSAVVAKIPGGVQLEVIEDSGQFYLVKLMGGKQGYLSKARSQG